MIQKGLYPIFSKDEWTTESAAAVGYSKTEWYDLAIERNSEGFVLEISGNFKGTEKETRRATIGFDEGKVWHYNMPGEKEPAFDVNPQSWRAGGYPEYFIFGVPHINWYKGNAYFDDLKLYQGSLK